MLLRRTSKFRLLQSQAHSIDLMLIKVDGSSGAYNIRLLSLERAERRQNYCKLGAL